MVAVLVRPAKLAGIFGDREDFNEKAYRTIVAMFSLFFVSCKAGHSSSLPPIDRQCVFEYSGKIQSYLDVYKEIWNSAVPTDYVISNAKSYDNPQYYAARAVNSPEFGVVVNTGEPRGGNLFFCGINGEGDVYEERNVYVACSLFCQVDFSNVSWAPDPYFVGKTVNMAICYVTVSYANQSIHSDNAHKNKVIWLFEKDEHLSYFVSVGSGSNPRIDSSLERPYETAFSIETLKRFYLGIGEYQLTAIDAFNMRGVDDDAGVLGIGYDAPQSFMLRSSADSLEVNMTFSTKNSACFNDKDLNDCYFFAPQRVTFDSRDVLETIIDKNIFVKSPDSLVRNHLTKISLNKLAKAVSGNTAIYESGKKGLLCRTASLFENVDTVYDRSFTSQSVCLCGTYSEGQLMSPMAMWPDSLDIYCIPFGADWWPSVISITQSNPYCDVPIMNPIRYFSHPHLMFEYLKNNGHDIGIQ